MRNVEIERIPPTLKSLGVGGVLGSSLGTTAFYALPELRNNGVTIELAATVGTAMIAGLHRLITAPPVRYYLLMVALLFEVQIGWMTPRDARLIRMQLQQDHYLGKLKSGPRPSLPTGAAPAERSSRGSAAERGADSPTLQIAPPSGLHPAEAPH